MSPPYFKWNIEIFTPIFHFVLYRQKPRKWNSCWKNCHFKDSKEMTKFNRKVLIKTLNNFRRTLLFLSFFVHNFCLLQIMYLLIIYLFAAINLFIFFIFGRICQSTWINEMECFWNRCQQQIYNVRNNDI